MILGREGSELHRKIDQLQEEHDTEQLPITGKRFSLLIHRGNQLLDPNYASWLTSNKALHFTFNSIKNRVWGSTITQKSVKKQVLGCSVNQKR